MSQTNINQPMTTAFPSQKTVPSRFRFGVALKMIVAVVTILIIVAVVQIAFSYRSSGQNIQLEAEHTLDAYFKTYQTKIEAEKNIAEALAIGVANRPDVQSLYLDGNRDSLFELLSPMFNQWKEREIVHLYIENPDGTVFLRVHNRANFGDDITYRGTANTALLEKRTTSGVEIGPSRLGIRAVTPMYNSTGKFIGLVEVGIDFDEKFMADLKKNTGADFTMWISNEAASTPKLKPAEGVPNAPIDELFYYASTDSSLPVANAEVYKSVLETGQSQYMILTENTSTPTIIYVTRLLGYNDKVLGIIQFSKPYTENLERLNTAFLSTLGVVGGLTIISLFLIWLLTSRLVLRPLAVLAQFAENQTSGKTNARVSLNTADEFEELAKTFNILANTVAQERETLEQRVSARTKDLATVAEVGTATSTILETDKLLKEVVELTKERFGLYHSHIYLLDEKGESLVLTAGAGEPGRIMVSEGHSIPLSREQSLVARAARDDADAPAKLRAAREGKGVTVNDVTQAPDFLPNPLLPDTRSELAVPMIVGGNVIGVFDVQSDQVGRFTDSDINIQTTLAAQVATSIQNVRSFEQSKVQADLESLVNTIGQKIQRATTVEDTLKIAIRELGTALGSRNTRAILKSPALAAQLVEQNVN